MHCRSFPCQTTGVIRAVVSLLLGAGLLGCTGDVGSMPGPDGSGAPPTEDPPSRAPDGDSPGGDPPVVFQPAPVALRKLTAKQYLNSVQDLLGVMPELPELEADTSINGFVAIGAAQATISPAAAEKLESAAFALAEAALDAEHRQAFVGCSPADASCAESFLARFGRRAFRRPLTAEELARYAGLAKQGQGALGDFHAGLQLAVAAILQSPSFLFRAELGDPSTGTTVAYDDYELATRLSYLLWNTTPDDALLAAAGEHALSAPGGLAAQTDRLLADPRAKAALNVFHSERLLLDELEFVEKTDAVLPGGFDDGLKRAMTDDLLSTIEAFTFGGSADFRDLFTTPLAFVSGGLAELYGLPAGSSGRVSLPADGPRAGLLGKAALLATHAHSDGTSPTKRGKFIRQQLLCQSIPAPPPDVNTVLPEPDESAPTMRERLAAHVEVASCAGCHTLMDPLGLSLEHFDSMGRWRADDQGHALDVSGNLGGQDFAGMIELADLLRDDPAATECLARQLYRYATGHVESAGEEPAVQEVLAAFAANGYSFSALLRAVIASEGFRLGAKP